MGILLFPFSLFSLSPSLFHYSLFLYSLSLSLSLSLLTFFHPFANTNEWETGKKSYFMAIDVSYTFLSLSPLSLFSLSFLFLPSVYFLLSLSHFFQILSFLLTQFFRPLSNPCTLIYSTENEDVLREEANRSSSMQ